LDCIIVWFWYLIYWLTDHTLLLFALYIYDILHLFTLHLLFTFLLLLHTCIGCWLPHLVIYLLVVVIIVDSYYLPHDDIVGLIVITLVIVPFVYTVYSIIGLYDLLLLVVSWLCSYTVILQLGYCLIYSLFGLPIIVLLWITVICIVCGYSYLYSHIPGCYSTFICYCVPYIWFLCTAQRYLDCRLCPIPTLLLQPILQIYPCLDCDYLGFLILDCGPDCITSVPVVIVPCSPALLVYSLVVVTLWPAPLYALYSLCLG